MTRGLPIDAEWLSGSILRWSFPECVRVSGFELRAKPGERDRWAPRGQLLSLRVGDVEQLAVSPAMLIHVVQWQLFDCYGWSSPAAGWKIGPLMLSTVELGEALRLELVDFDGEIRPYGVSARRHPPNLRLVST